MPLLNVPDRRGWVGFGESERFWMVLAAGPVSFLTFWCLRNRTRRGPTAARAAATEPRAPSPPVVALQARVTPSLHTERLSLAFVLSVDFIPWEKYSHTAALTGIGIIPNVLGSRIDFCISLYLMIYSLLRNN